MRLKVITDWQVSQITEIETLSVVMRPLACSILVIICRENGINSQLN